MNTKELKRVIEQATDSPIDWSHISLINDMFNSLNLNIKIETENTPNEQVIRLIAGSEEKV